MLVGIVGFRGAGKNTIGKQLVDKCEYITDAFANSLKDAAANIFGWERAMLEGDTKESRFWRAQADRFWSEKLGIRNFTPEMALQWLGTEGCRKVFGEDIWVSTVERRWINADKPKTVIPDCRFKNEIEFIRKNKGKVIRVDREPEPHWFQLVLWANKGMADRDDLSELRQMRSSGMVPHESETAWIGCSVDEIIDNFGTLEELAAKVDIVIKRLGL